MSAVPESSAELKPAVAAYLAQKLHAEQVELNGFRRHIEGFSWETYSMTAVVDHEACQRGFVMHRAPAAGVLEPYDAKRLYELLVVLRGARQVPVAQPRWCDPSGRAVGRPMYMVDKLDGDTPTPWTVAAYFGDDRIRHAVGRQFAALAARIHEVRLEGLPSGLIGLGSADPVEALIDHWQDMYERSRLEPYPAAEYIYGWLQRNKNMTSGRTTLVHGDFRIGNFIVQDGQISAMLDWETAHVGDPAEDLACATLKQLRGGRLSDAGGMLPLEEFLAEYEEQAGWSVPREAIQYWWVMNAAAGVAQWAAAMRHFEDGRTRDARYPTVAYQIFAYSTKDALAIIEGVRAGEPPWPLGGHA